MNGNERLSSELFDVYKDGTKPATLGYPAACNKAIPQHYQPHFFTGSPITRQDQVQIYEELTRDSDGRFTTNFTRRFELVKDNRLLPIDWTEHGPDPSLNGRFLEATHPEGSARDDPDYHDGRGTDRVTYRMTLPADVDPATCTVAATLHYQATPPYYLDQRFQAAPDGDATRRLYYLASNLELDGTPAEGWKLPLVSATASVRVP